MNENLKIFCEQLLNLLGITIGVFAFIILVFGLVFQMSKVFDITQINPELINTSISLILLFITAVYVTFTWKIVDESRKSRLITEQIVDETRKGHKVALIERRLEKLYLPLKDILENPLRYQSDEPELEWKKLDKIIPFQYLASKELKGMLNEFIKKVIEGKKKNFLPFEDFSNKNIKGIIEKDIENFKIELAELIE